jgi:hypothetical protein
MAESPLLRLPTELRDIIFGYIFTGLYVEVRRSMRFKPVNLAHPDFLSVCRVIYRSAQLLPFLSARFIFMATRIESKCEGVSSMWNFYSLDDIEALQLRARAIPIFRYSAQVNSIATLHTRVNQLPLGYFHDRLYADANVGFLPGLKQIILRPSYKKENIREDIFEVMLNLDREKVLRLREMVNSSIQVVFEEGELPDYEFWSGI